ncbi:MAG: 5-formyltetrahydrofolate cyclo-ligase, partial [Nitrospirae bacterium RIFCSPLOW2_12_42_9]
MLTTLKKGIREEILCKRDRLNLQERAELSSIICNNLLNLYEYKQAKVVHFYLTIKSEVITEDAVKSAISTGKDVVIPVMDKRHKRILLSGLNDYDKELAPTSHGIIEPKPEFYKFVDLNDIDLMVLPGVAFDLNGHRLGYGAGYYDRLLRDADTRPFLVALAFEVQIVNK